MSVAAVMLVRDEADIIETVVRHLLGNVDEVIVADNMSTDGTREILAGLPVLLRNDLEVGYYQSRKTTELATVALSRGHEWVVPCDADEVWYSQDGRRLADFLAGVAPDVKTVRALIYNHFPTSADPPGEPNPVKRIGWRHREHQPGQFGKVACRLLPGLQIAMGNHTAWAHPPGNEIGGFLIRHFSWRTEAQYLRKIRTGERAYAATDLPESTGAHWRMFTGRPDEAVVQQFRDWFYFEGPEYRDDFTYDPAPVRE